MEDLREREERKQYVGPYASSWKALRIRSISASFLGGKGG